MSGVHVLVGLSTNVIIPSFPVHSFFMHVSLPRNLILCTHHNFSKVTLSGHLIHLSDCSEDRNGQSPILTVVDRNVFNILLISSGY